MSKDLLHEAFWFAAECHRGQIDRDGKPHVFHAIHVAMKQPTVVGMISGLLHDVLEDCKDGECDRLKVDILQKFGNEVLENVVLLTRTEGMPWSKHIENVCSSPIAASVKKADIEHNTSPGRMDMKAAKRMPMYIEGYAKVCQTLGITRHINV
jgi:(p)ppGpp synthase/HD superfamily hydrolase